MEATGNNQNQNNISPTMLDWLRYKARSKTYISYTDFMAVVSYFEDTKLQNSKSHEQLSDCDERVFMKQVYEAHSVLLTILNSGRLSKSLHLVDQTIYDLDNLMHKFFDENVEMEKKK